jgi:hypothetical protein
MTDRSESDDAGGSRSTCARTSIVAFLAFFWLVGLLGSVTTTRHQSLIIPKLKAGKDQSDTETREPNKHRKVKENRNNQRHGTFHRRMKLLQRGGFVNCSEYEYSLSITDKLKVKYVVNADETTPGKGTLSVEMEYLGVAWLGFAHSESGIMVGSLGIIGLPDSAAEELQVQKFKLGGLDVGSPGGITPLKADRQTLIKSSLEQTEYYTVMRFTKLLMEPDELSIHPNLQNTFLFAHGAGNSFGYHETRGVAVLDLKPCVQSVLPVEAVEADAEAEKRRFDEDSYVLVIGNSPLDGGSPSHVNITSESIADEALGAETIGPSIRVGEAQKKLDFTDQFTATNDSLNDNDTGFSTSESTSQRSITKLWLTVHGVCATLSCGILLPLVVGSSLLQGCCGGERENSCFCHVFNRWGNVLILFAASATFMTAVIGVLHDSAHTRAIRGEHRVELSKKPETSHAPIGVALAIIVFFYSLIGSLRSCLMRTPKTSRKSECRSGPSDYNGEDIKNMDLHMTRFATHFDQCHCIVGIILIGLSCWQCQVGLNLFEYRFPESWFTTEFFWGISGTCLGIVTCLCLLQLVSEGRSKTVNRTSSCS